MDGSWTESQKIYAEVWTHLDSIIKHLERWYGCLNLGKTKEARMARALNLLPLHDSEVNSSKDTVLLTDFLVKFARMLLVIETYCTVA